MRIPIHPLMNRARAAVFAVSLAATSLGHASALEVDEDIGEVPSPGSKRNWFVVPVPISSPTLGSGAVLGGAYFHPQSAQQKALQPPSVTGAGVMYTDNKSKAFAIGHQAYLKSDKWRLTAVAGAVDFNLELRPAGPAAKGIDWKVKGGGLYFGASRAIIGKWRIGGFTRYLNIDEEFGAGIEGNGFMLDTNTVGAGIGAVVEYDSRDKPFNPYSGSRLKIGVLASSKKLGGDDSYESYEFNYTSYHDVHPSVVVAWQVRGCHRSDDTPLWDACVINLRGFPVIDYLGKTSALAQVEARWRFYKKWGVVAFAGAGTYRNSFSEYRDRDAIPSYGLGLRFMVLESERINLRIDYGRSKSGDSAIYIGVMEAF